MSVAAECAPFVLTETHVEEFYREGYFFAPRLITRETVASINHCYAEKIASKPGTEWQSYGFEPSAHMFLKTPEMVRMFAAILGGSTRLWLGMYAVVAPGGEGLAWHQDNQYTHIFGHMLNAFVALDTITQENAGLWIAPRSHRLGRQPDLNADTALDHRRAADPENGTPCPPMAAGDAIIFHRELTHRSLTNHTDKPRRAFAFQVSAANCRYAESGKMLDDKELLTA